MRKWILVVTGLWAVLHGEAQNNTLTQTVRGVVTDKTSEKPLAGVSISVMGPGFTMGTVTDGSGRYVLPAVPFGRQQFSYGCVAYHPPSIPDRLATSRND